MQSESNLLIYIINAALCRTARGADDSIPWPSTPLQQALLLRQQCNRMVSDFDSVCSAYKDALTEFLPSIQSAANADDGCEKDEAADQPLVSAEDATALEQLTHNILHELGAASGNGVSRLEEGFRGLLYVTIVRELVTRIAQ